MAEKIVIEIVADGAGVEPGIKAVEKLGTAAEKDVAAFNKLNQTIGNDTSAAVKKVVISAEQARKAFADASKGGKDGFAQIREEVVKTTQATDNQTKALRAQIQEAKKLQAQLAQTFGENSTQANNAAKNVAKLTELQDDLNKRAQAFNPEAFQAFTQVTQGLFGSFQALTGAMQLFGVESEQAQKIAQQFQGAINVTQGLNSILGLKDAFGNLRAVLGLTAAAQTTLAVATEAQAAATVTATGATTAFSVALTATGIGAIVVAIGALVAGYIALSEAIDKGADALEELERKQEQFLANQKLFDDVFESAQDKRLTGLRREIEILEAQGASKSVLLAKQKELFEVELATNRAAIASGKGTDEFADKLIKRDAEIIHQLQLIQIEYAKFVRGTNIDPIPLQFTFPTALTSEQQSQLKELAKQFRDGLFDEEAYKEKISEVMGNVISLAKVKVKENPVVLFDPANTNATDLSRQYFEQQKEELDAFYADAGQFLQDYGDVVQGFFNLSNELSAAETEDRLANLEKQKDAGIITQQQYEQRVKQIRREAAASQKAQALFQGAIQTAQAIINALTVTPATAVPAAVALASTLGALQLATIAARPLPKFKEGHLPQTPGYFTGDNQLGLFDKNETILTADQTRDYFPAVSAIYKRTVTPEILNSFVTGNQVVRHNVKARISPSDIRYGMDGASINIRNSDRLAKSIGEAVASELRTSRVQQKRT